MYLWRKLSDKQRDIVFRQRQLRRFPWHSPPHFNFEDQKEFLISAACFEHQPHIGRTPERLTEFTVDLLTALKNSPHELFAWCVLPNHYHLLIKTPALKLLTKDLGLLHGRNSYRWNREENARGRTVFHRAADRAMRSQAHYWATINYIHNNPVHHRYVKKWDEWPWSSAADFLREFERAEAERIWKEYPVLEYGEGWDSAEL